MMTEAERHDLLDAMCAEAYDNGRPEWLTQLAKRMGYVSAYPTPSCAADFLITNGVTTWTDVARTHE